jgi:hypothetical protein
MEEISLASLPTTAEENKSNPNKPNNSFALLHNRDSTRKIREVGKQDGSLDDRDSKSLLGMPETINDDQKNSVAGTSVLNTEVSSPDQAASDKPKPHEAILAGTALEMWMRTRDGGKVSLLLDSLGGDIKIPTEAFIGAATNHNYGEDVMALLLDRSTTELQITPAVVKAAVQNEDCGDRVLRLLLDRCGLDMELPKDIVEVASRNERLGDRLMLILSKNFPHIVGTAASNEVEAKHPVTSTTISLLDKDSVIGTPGVSHDTRIKTIERILGIPKDMPMSGKGTSPKKTTRTRRKLPPTVPNAHPDTATEKNGPTPPDMDQDAATKIMDALTKAESQA